MSSKYDWRTGRARSIPSEQMRGKELILPDLSVVALLPDDPTGRVVRTEIANACFDLGEALSAPFPDGESIFRAQMNLARLLVEFGSGMIEADDQADAAFGPKRVH